MRFQHFVLGFLLVLPLCFTLSAWSQLTYTIPVLDKSEPGSPLKISGTASFFDQIVANSVTVSGDFKVNARNIAGKGIILLLAYFDAAGPHAGGTHNVIQIDHLFWGEIAPGQSFPLARSRPGRRTSVCCINPVAPAEEPKAEVSIQYVQFVDGSTFGDETSAKQILGTRSVILDALRRLDNAGSNEEFLGLLEQRIQPDEADDFLKILRHTKKNHGTATARNQVHAAVVAAEAHAAALRTVQAAQR